MRYARKGRKGFRGRRRSARGSLRSMARSRPTRFKKLAKSVYRLQRAVSTGGQIIKTKFSVNDTTASADYFHFPLCNYAGQSMIFGSTTAQTTDRRVKHLSSAIDIFLNSSSEDDTIQYTMVIVSLKDIMSTQVNFSNTYLTLTNGLHYEMINGTCVMNTEFFNIHYSKRFTLGNNGNGATGASATSGPGRWDRRFFRIQRIGTRPSAPIGSWKDMACPRDPSQNFYVILFNDNSVLDLENPGITVNCIHTFKTL